jgi:hypothetical protein
MRERASEKRCWIRRVVGPTPAPLPCGAAGWAGLSWVGKLSDQVINNGFGGIAKTCLPMGISWSWCLSVLGSPCSGNQEQHHKLASEWVSWVSIATIGWSLRHQDTSMFESAYRVLFVLRISRRPYCLRWRGLPTEMVTFAGSRSRQPNQRWVNSPSPSFLKNLSLRSQFDMARQLPTRRQQHTIIYI